MARPSKLTTALIAKLDEIADEGRSLKQVCTHLGITENTFRAWEASSGNDAFLSAAARVRARANEGMLDKCDGVIAAAFDDPDMRPGEKAALAIQYKRLVGSHKIELTGKDGGPVEVDIAGAKDLLMAGIDRLVPKSDDAGA